MNLFEFLYNGLERDYQNSLLIEKIFYIVKTMCEYFQYDGRWLWSVDDDTLKNEIFDYELDIFNVKSKKIVCSSFSKAYCELANSLLSCDANYDISLTEGEESHVYAKTYLVDGTIIKIDPFKYTNDLLNIKKGLPFKAFKIVNTNNFEYLEKEESLKKRSTNNDLYLDYLKLLREEICLNQSLTKKKENEIFKFIIKYSNFNNLGLKEASDLILTSLIRITMKNSYNLDYKRHILYDCQKKDNNLIYQIPKDDKAYEFYKMYLDNDKIKFDYITIEELYNMKKYRCKDNTLIKALEKNE